MIGENDDGSGGWIGRTMKRRDGSMSPGSCEPSLRGVLATKQSILFFARIASLLAMTANKPG
jgi:hypothetical protein